jgi:hypothetical protein
MRDTLRSRYNHPNVPSFMRDSLQGQKDWGSRTICHISILFAHFRTACRSKSHSYTYHYRNLAGMMKCLCTAHVHRLTHQDQCAQDAALKIHTVIIKRPLDAKATYQSSCAYSPTDSSDGTANTGFPYKADSCFMPSQTAPWQLAA